MIVSLRSGILERGAMASTRYASEYIPDLSAASAGFGGNSDGPKDSKDSCTVVRDCAQDGGDRLKYIAMVGTLDARHTFSVTPTQYY